MSMPINAKAFDDMVNQDIEWLKKNAPDSFLYKDHIILCLDMAKKYYREVGLPNTPKKAWDC